MEVGEDTGLTIFSFEDLIYLTDNFSDENFIGKTQFGKVYRGKIPQGWNGMAEQDVTVKMWADKLHMFTDETCNTVAKNGDRFREEISFLTGDVALNCPFVAKLKGFCSEKMGVVYDLDSLDTLHKLIIGGTLKWVDRIRILYQFALVLERLHLQQPECLVRNISAAHIMIDQDLKPVLFEFGMLCSGQIADAHAPYPYGAFGYTDPSILTAGVFSCKVDIFSFAVLILELLCKCPVDLPIRLKSSKWLLHCYAEEIYKSEKSQSFVSKRFDAEPTCYAQDTIELLELATNCLRFSDPWSRPSMSEIVKLLEGLSVFPEMSSYGSKLLLNRLLLFDSA